MRDLVEHLNRLGEIQPAPGATSHSLRRVRGALAAQRPSDGFRSLRRFSLAAAVLMVVCGGIVWLLHAPEVHASFADVEAAVMSARSVSFRMVRHVTDEPEGTTCTWVRGDGFSRVEY